MTSQNFIHLVQHEEEGVIPLCGSFAKGVNWTVSPNVVTCPECLARLRAMAKKPSRSPEPGGGAPPGRT